MTDLTQYKFSGLQVCKLTGLTSNQFQSFKQAGLIENKPKYNINDVIYVFISNFFREQNKSWLSIKNLYDDIIGVNKFNKISFIDLEGIVINFEKKTCDLMSKNDSILSFPNNTINHMSELESLKIIESMTVFENKLFKKNFNGYCIYFKDNFCAFDMNLILKEIVKNSDKAHLKVDLKKALNVA